MSDSEAIVPVTVAPEVAPGPEIRTKLVKGKNGEVRELTFDKNGKFLKKKSDKRELNEDQSKSLARREAKKDDNWLKIIRAQIKLAQAVDNPETAQASTKAAEWLRALMYGKLSLSDSDKESREHDGVKVVIVTQPQAQEGVDHTKIEKPTQPSWIDAEVVSTNEAPKAE